MGFILSRRSLKNLEGVHEDLVRVVQRAIEITEVDFTIRWVDRNPGVGEWEEVPRLEDFTIRFVESGEDVKVRFVYH